MTTRVTLVTISALLAVAAPSVALANPATPPGEYPLAAQRFPELFLFLFLSLFVLEGLLITILARESSVYRFRFVALWTGVTIVTFGFFYFFLVAATDVFSLGETASIILGEAAVILIEAWCISFLLGRTTLARNPQACPGFSRALAYSLAVNLASLEGYVILETLDGLVSGRLVFPWDPPPLF